MSRKPFSSNLQMKFSTVFLYILCGLTLVAASPGTQFGAPHSLLQARGGAYSKQKAHALASYYPECKSIRASDYCDAHCKCARKELYCENYPEALPMLQKLKWRLEREGACRELCKCKKYPSLSR